MWFPGAGFKAIARHMREDLERLYDVPYDFVKTAMVGVIYLVLYWSDACFIVVDYISESRQRFAILHFVLS